MNLASLDLNLLVSLRALLQERNVTRAGQAVGLSQPAMSNALARLRRLFGDDLLVRDGRNLELTPVARELQHAVEPALAMVERTFRLQISFDPATATQVFRIGATDYGMTVVGDRLDGLHRVAPGIVVDLIQLDRGFVRDTETVLRETDLLVAPRAFITGYPSVELSRASWVGVVDAGAGPVADRLDEVDLRGRPLVGLFHDVGAGAHIERMLSVRGIAGSGNVNADSFFVVPSLVSGTDRVGFLPRDLAHRLAPAYGLHVLELPFLGSELVECAYWHRSAERDPAHAWLRRLLVNGPRPAAALEASG